MVVVTCERRRDAVAAGLLGLVAAAAAWVVHRHTRPLLVPDSPLYLDYLKRRAAYWPGSRAPLYPILAAACGGDTGHIVAVQAALGALLPVLVFGLARCWLSRRAAVALAIEQVCLH